MMEKKAYVAPDIKITQLETGDIIMASGYIESIRSVTLGVAEVKYIDID